MLRSVKMNILNLVPPTGIEVTSVKYELNSLSSFLGEIIDVLVTPSLKYSYQYNFVNDEVIYGRVTATFNDGNTWKSNTLALTVDGYMDSDVQVYPPKVKVESYRKINNLANKAMIVVEEPIFFMGTGTWVATTWIVRDLAGNILNTREYDEDNKETYELHLSPYDTHDIILLEVKYEFLEKVVVARNLIPIKVNKKELNFGIDKYNISSSYVENIVNVVAPTFEIVSQEWYVSNKQGLPLQQGVGDIIILGNNVRDLEFVDLHVTIHTLKYGSKDGVFELHVDNEFTGFPVTLPYTTI